MRKRIIMTLIIALMMLAGTTLSFADSDPGVVVINPGQYSTVYSDNLLVSVKVLEPKTIRISFYEELELRNDVAVSVNVNNISNIEDLLGITDLTSVLVYDKEIFDCSNYLSFYTKSLEGLTPGLYRIKVETLGAYGETTHSSNTHVIIKDKDLEPSSDESIFGETEPTTMEIFQNFFSNIFGN